MSEAALHARLLTLDAHLDTPVHLARPGWRFEDRHGRDDDLAQLDLPRMAGTLDGGCFVVFTPQGPLTAAGYAEALDWAHRRSDAIDATLARLPDRLGLARTPEDAHRLKAEGKTVVFKSIENSYPLGERIELLADFHARGVRMAGAVHSRGNQIADSATDAPTWHGLSDLGRAWVAEMNRLGMVIDASHASDAAFDQMLDRSAAPILLSHSGSRTAFDHPRNIDDGRLRALAQQGGVICFATIFLSAMHGGAERLAMLRALDGMEGMDPIAHTALVGRWRALDATQPMWTAGFEEYVAALLHVIAVAGVDHVGFGADWDGGGGLPGLEDVTALPSVTARLREAGLSEADCAKLWSGNLLRVMRQAQAGAD